MGRDSSKAALVWLLGGDSSCNLLLSPHDKRSETPPHQSYYEKLDFTKLFSNMSYPGFVASPDSFTKMGHSKEHKPGPGLANRPFPLPRSLTFTDAVPPVCHSAAGLLLGSLLSEGHEQQIPKWDLSLLLPLLTCHPAGPRSVLPPSPKEGTQAAGGPSAECSQLGQAEPRKYIPEFTFCSLKPVFICAAGDGSPSLPSLTHVFPRAKMKIRHSSPSAGTVLCLHKASDNAKLNVWPRTIFC